MGVNIEEIKAFAVKSIQEGWASKNKLLTMVESDGSTSVIVRDRNWMSRDTYFGTNPFAGRLVIFYRGKAAWALMYHGKVRPEVADAQEVFELYGQALAHVPFEAPYRGPASIANRQQDLVYTNAWEGSFAQFSGQEKMHDRDVLTYSGNYIGGLIG